MSALPSFLPQVDLVELPAGARVIVRPMSIIDVAALKRMWRRLSQRTIYRRFMTSCPKPPSERMLQYLAGVDHRTRDALVAVMMNEIVGVARYHTIADGEAEIAVLVEDAWQGRGLGRELTTRIAELARDRGITVFSGAMLAENDAAFALLRSVFPQASSRTSHGEREFRILL